MAVTILPYAVIVQSTAAAIPSLAYQGDQAVVKDENGRTWGWSGTAYQNYPAIIAALQSGVITLGGGTPSGIPVINTSSTPSVSGTAASGSTVSGSHAAYSNTPTSWRGRFYRVGVLMPATEATVSGGTLVTWTPGDSEKGLKISYGEFARNATGESTPEVMSPEVIVSGGIAPDYTAAGSTPPGIVEAPGAAPGVTLHVDIGAPGAGNVDPRLTALRWDANGSIVSGRTGTSFDTTGYASQSTFRCLVTLANSAFTGVEEPTAGYTVI